jgi:SAM-dependent methyltransferase
MSQATLTPAQIDVDELRSTVQKVYHDVAIDPTGDRHFEMGRPLAERLGYRPADLDGVPPEAIASFAGVGYHLDFAELRAGETVVDLGSGSGMDSFLAAAAVAPGGRVIGIDMTPAQLAKAEGLRRAVGFEQVTFRRAFIEELPLEDGSVDVVISNGVVNLSADKAGAFREIFRVLRPGGRLAISDIVTEKELTESISCNVSLWAACIGGAAQEGSYRSLIEGAGLELEVVRENGQYAFLSTSAKNATETYGVKSVSLLAHKPI